MPTEPVGRRGATPRSRAAEALRELGHALVAHDADPDLLERVEAAARRVTADVAASPRILRDERSMKEAMFSRPTVDGTVIRHFDQCFVSGVDNPLGIGMIVTRRGEEVEAEVRLGAAFEGAPGRSHGGIVAAIFDDLAGYLLSVHKVPAFTGELTVRYHAATPVGPPVRFGARLVGRDGRKLSIEAEAFDGETLLATARATMIAISAYRPDTGRDD